MSLAIVWSKPEFATLKIKKNTAKKPPVRTLFGCTLIKFFTKLTYYLLTNLLELTRNLLELTKKSANMTYCVQVFQYFLASVISKLSKMGPDFGPRDIRA